MTARGMKPGASESAESLWARYKASGDTKARESLVSRLAPMVTDLAYRRVRRLPSHYRAEDFVSTGFEALLRAIDRYDPAEGATLETFVWRRVRGAMIDELRRNDWAPRTVRGWEKEITRARDRLSAVNQRTPSPDEVGNLLHLRAGDLDRHLSAIFQAEIVSLNVVVNEEGEPVERVEVVASSSPDDDPDLALIREEATETVRAAVASLPARDQELVSLLYVHDCRLREIGARFGVSESRVCQLHRGVRERLRSQLADDPHPFEAAA
jgi:RNA polymerase sigma factor FliA